MNLQFNIDYLNNSNLNTNKIGSMGAYTSQIVPVDSEIISQSLKPTSPDWIIAHVDACDVTIIKVQRCWHRFQQMGCNKNGNLTTKSKVWSSETNKFLQQVARHSFLHLQRVYVYVIGDCCSLGTETMY